MSAIEKLTKPKYIIEVLIVSNRDFILLEPPEKSRDCLLRLSFQGWETEAFYSLAPIPNWLRFTSESVNFLVLLSYI